MKMPIEQILVYGNMSSSIFYKTPVWRKARYQALTQYGNRCQLCGAGPTASSLHVDHIKPRILFPELCLDPNNLQVLCEDCHIAKGIEYIDDCLGKLTQLPAIEMRDFLRIERRHLVLAHRHPKNRSEAKYLGDGIRSPHKKHRQRWRAFVDFCFNDKRSYSSATQIRVGEFMLTPFPRNPRYAKFVFNKHPNDFVFDIGGCLFPLNISDLLADDQLGGEV